MTNQGMASHAHAHRTLNDHSTQADAVGCSDLWLWEDGKIDPMTQSAYTFGILETDALLPATTDMLEIPNNLNITQTEDDNDFAAPIEDFNVYVDSFGSFGSVPPPTEPFVMLHNQVGDWSRLPSSTVIPCGLQFLSSTSQTHRPLAPTNLAPGEYLCVGSFNDGNRCSPGPSSLVDNSLQLLDRDACNVSGDNRYGQTITQDFFENRTAYLPHIDPNLVQNNGKTIQYPSPSMQDPDVTLSLYGTTHLVYDRAEQNFELPKLEAGDVLFPNTNYQNQECDSYVIDTSYTSNREFSSTSWIPNMTETSKAAEGPHKDRLIMPWPSANGTHQKAGADHGMQTSRVGKGPGRKRVLSAEQRKKAADMRRWRACASCYASHVACSFGNPCQRCANNPHLGMPCNRDDLGIYLESLSPPFFGGHLTREAIQKFIYPLQFINNEIYTELSTDPSYPIIQLPVCEFVPADMDILKVQDPDPQSHVNVPSFRYVRSLQWGVLKHNDDQLKLRCLEHVEAVSSSDTIIGDCDTLSWKIMDAIFRFQKTDPIARSNNLLAQAIKVNRLHYILGTNIFFSSTAVDKAIESLRASASGLPCRSRVSSRILTKQVKGVMTDLLNECTKKLLFDFNTELRNHRSSTWLLCLMTHLILCICGEEIQTAVDGFIVFQIPRGACDPVTLRKCGTEVCRRVEHVVLEHSWTLLRGKLRSLLKKQNPFQDSYQAAEGKVPTESELRLINEIREVMKIHKEEIYKKSEDAYYGGSSRTPSDTNKFGKSNSSRLLSKFIKRLY